MVFLGYICAPQARLACLYNNIIYRVMTLLLIETSTTVCSVAVAVDGRCLMQELNAEGQNHAQLLGVFVQRAAEFMKGQGLRPDAVAVSRGPGSYTGLRIGTATAKGLCFGWEVPLVAVDTLQVMAAAAREQVPDGDALLCPMIDARRMEVYTALYGHDLNALTPAEPLVVAEGAFADRLEQGQVWFFGNGMDKCRPLLAHRNARFVDGIVPQAMYMGALAEERCRAGLFEDVAYFDPFYLKEFQATVPKKNLLG